MARTAQAVIDRARTPLNDPGKLRWADALLLGYLNDAILLLRTKRPDLFYGNYATLPGAEIGLGANIPVGDEFLPNMADYVTARALFAEDEDAVQSQAASFFKLWSS